MTDGSAFLGAKLNLDAYPMKLGVASGLSLSTRFKSASLDYVPFSQVKISSSKHIESTLCRYCPNASFYSSILNSSCNSEDSLYFYFLIALGFVSILRFLDSKNLRTLLLFCFFIGGIDYSSYFQCTLPLRKVKSNSRW